MWLQPVLKTKDLVQGSLSKVLLLRDARHALEFEVLGGFSIFGRTGGLACRVSRLRSDLTL